MASSDLTRRGFLGLSAATLAALAAPRRVCAASPLVTAMPRIGFIGLGAAGLEHLEQLKPHCAALCDVDADRLAHARSLVGRRVPETADYRRILESPDIDAVVIATPDHWHAYQAVHACQAGKDLLIETPLGATPGQAAAVEEAVARFGRVAQTTIRVLLSPDLAGPSSDGPWTCWGRPNPSGGNPGQTGPPPASLDWDMWLGPASERPYNPSWAHHYFRWVLDLGGGRIQQEGLPVLAATADAAAMCICA